MPNRNTGSNSNSNFIKGISSISSFFTNLFQADRKSSNRLKEFSKLNSISEFLPYKGFDKENGIYYNEDTVGFVFESIPLVGIDGDLEEQLESLFSYILPEESSIQFMLLASNKVAHILDDWHRERIGRVNINKENKENKANQDNIFSYLASKRVEFYKNSKAGRNFRLIISYSEKLDKKKNIPQFGLDKVSQQKLLNLKQRIKSLFETNNLPIAEIKPQGLISLLKEIVNFSDDQNMDRVNYNPYDSISDQVGSFENRLEIKDDEILIHHNSSNSFNINTNINNQNVIKTFIVNDYPNDWDLSYMNFLIGDSKEDLLKIECPFIIHYGIFIESQDKHKTGMMAKGLRVERLASGPLARFVSGIREEAHEWQSYFEESGTDSRIVKTSLSCALMTDQKKLINNEEKIKSIFRRSGFKLESQRYMQLLGLISILPMGFCNSLKEDLFFYNRLKTTTSKEPAGFLPIAGEWQGTRSQGMLLKGRRGQLITWSPFDNDGGNYNVTIVGTPGSGKSVFMQDMITSHLGIGARAFILDKGRSYEKLTKLLNGRFVEFTSKIKLCLNPFTNIPTQTKEMAEESLSMLTPVIANMVAPLRGVSDIENGYISEAIRKVWDKKRNNAEIEDIRAWFLKQASEQPNNEIVRNLGIMLNPYGKDGIYGRYFNGTANFNIDDRNSQTLFNNLITFELEELSSKKDLQVVIIQMLIMQISNKMLLGDRKTPFMIVIDEAWDLLRGKESGEFIEKLVRCCRKAFGSIVVGTQNINDFNQSPAAQACLANSDWKCFLRLNLENIDQMQVDDNFKLDPNKASLMKTLKTKQGEYSEILITSGGSYTVARLALDTFSAKLYSTKADEYTEVMTELEKGRDLKEVIEDLIGG